MNTESIDCQLVEEIGKVGDFKFSEDRDHIYIWVPGMSGPDAIRITRDHATYARASSIWLWDGSEDKPTLSPSIHAPGQWHGFLTNGRLQSC